jgi:hypothetical protein
MRLVLALFLVLSGCGASLRAEATRSRVAKGGGLSPDVVHNVVRARVPAVVACYERFAKGESRPMGVVRFGWHIEPSGAVSGVQIVATTLHSSSIEGCIADEVAKWQFPATPLATEVEQYPFTF